MPDLIPLKLLVTIVDRGKGESAVALYRANRLHFEYLCMGLGTANSKTLDYFGLSETEKDVVLTLVPGPKVGEVIEAANEKFGLTRPGRGILFTIPLSGAGRRIPMLLCKPGSLPGDLKEEPTMETSTRYDLILTVVNRGNTDTVMDAARAEGARGGTVIYARRVGDEDRDSLLGFSLQPEKEIVIILTPRAQRHGMMVAINKACGLTTEAGGILFSLPVNDMMGLQPPIPEEPAGSE